MQNFANHATSPCINGTILASDDLLYRFYKATSVDTITCTAITITAPGGGIPSSSGFNDVLVQNGKLYALNNSNQTHLYYSAVTDSAAVSSVIYVTGSQNINSGINPTTVGRSIDLSNNDKMISVVGDGGRFERGAFATGVPGTVTWVVGQEPSSNIKGLPKRASDYSGSLTVSCGDNGQMTGYYFNGSVSQYYAKILTTGIKADLNEMQFTGSGAGYMVGDEGKVYSFSLSSFTVTPTAVSVPVSVDLNDITVSSNKAYIAGDDGTILYTSNITTPGSFSIASKVTQDDLYAVEFVPTKNFAVAAGDNAHLRWCMGTNAMTNKNFYQFPLNKVNFRNINNGYVVGNRYTIKHTADGGGTWTTVETASTNAPISHAVHDVQSVKTIMNNQAVVVGARSYIGHVDDSVGNANLVALSQNYTDVDFAVPTLGFVGGYNITGGDGQVKVLDFDTTTHTLTLNTTFPAVTSTHLSGRRVNAVQAFKNSSVKFALFFQGTNSNRVVTHNGTSSTLSGAIAGMSTSVVVKDAYFHDNEVGYLVGQDGQLWKNTGFTTSASGWTQISVNDSLNSQLVTTDMDINAIAFCSRTKGFMGGLYNGTASGINNTNKNYARTIKDESGYYSTLFWYDRLGRIVVSQNTRQFNQSPKKYSYTLYDALGRVVEAGEKTENHPSHMRFTQTQGTVVNNFFNPATIDDD
ncbi:MAG TPA: hypothetical protein VD905_14490, partial [Flavobacteriales bacterium]|nr:hypothetical protein [Flavobacteriales bacterium]